MKNLIVLALLMLCGCGRPDPEQRPRRPSEVVDFGDLYKQHCRGCHGAEGQLGPAPPLNDSLFLMIATDEDLSRVVTAGRKGTLMPAFAREHGGPLTPRQVEALVNGMRAKWSGSASELPRSPPAYSLSAAAPGDRPLANAQAGANVFARACASCHGAEGRGGSHAGPLNDAVFLALVSDQLLRRIVITGRPDLEMPDYRRDMSESGPLSSQDIADVVAYVASWRNQKSIRRLPEQASLGRSK